MDHEWDTIEVGQYVQVENCSVKDTYGTLSVNCNDYTKLHQLTDDIPTMPEPQDIGVSESILSGMVSGVLFGVPSLLLLSRKRTVPLERRYPS